LYHVVQRTLRIRSTFFPIGFPGFSFAGSALFPNFATGFFDLERARGRFDPFLIDNRLTTPDPTD
jgi:hypothetical protein